MLFLSANGCSQGHFFNNAKQDLFATGLKICGTNLVGLRTLEADRQTDRQNELAAPPTPEVLFFVNFNLSQSTLL